MRTTHFLLVSLLIIGISILSACNMPGSSAVAEATPTTRATATMILTATQTEIIPSATFTMTATETPLPEPSATATAEIPMAEVRRESNCRVGPGALYDLVAKYQVGQMLEVVAKDLGGGYWFVKNPDKPEEQCYLLGQNIVITGDTSALPKFTPQPSPTAAPYFEVSFKRFDNCQNEDYALFDVKNVGSVAFRSVYIRITDLQVSKSVEDVLNAFDLRVGCVLAKNIAPLDPGAAGYVASPPFKWKAIGHKLQAVLMLCTDKDLKGTCVTQSLPVK